MSKLQAKPSDSACAVPIGPGPTCCKPFQGLFQTTPARPAQGSHRFYPPIVTRMEKTFEPQTDMRLSVGRSHGHGHDHCHNNSKMPNVLPVTITSATELLIVMIMVKSMTTYVSFLQISFNSFFVLLFILVSQCFDTCFSSMRSYAYFVFFQILCSHETGGPSHGPSFADPHTLYTRKLGQP
ncbi:hypothetical protein B0J11DRAFT_148242 [Dendryphion nanum]|uniref:Uncharacterized protein n=1 Tax=Dendryphion nanum TaxID=256645 RepID=A0A9P9E987_9PLEO|nr:hypothetical protein B0J11DRAFT_148242 [Dendryphion nanum]